MLVERFTDIKSIGDVTSEKCLLNRVKNSQHS